MKHRIIPRIGDSNMEQVVESMTFEEPGIDVGDGYRICDGLWYPAPKKHARALKEIGRLFVAVYEEKVVGRASMEFFWVHPKHRGHNLSVEMHIRLIQTFGGPPVVQVIDGRKAVMTPQFSAQQHAKMTTGGLELIHRTYKAMVERGLLEAS